MRYPNEEGFIAAALAGLCQHSAAKTHYDVDELGERAVAIGRAVAKAYAKALDDEEPREPTEEDERSAPAASAEPDPQPPKAPKPKRDR